MSTNSRDSPKLIMAYLEKSKKRDSSVLSLVEQEHQSKKPNKGKKDVDKNMASVPNKDKSDAITAKTETDNIKKLLVPLLEKVDELRETVNNKYSKLEDAITTQKSEVSNEIHKLEETITSQREELKNSIAPNPRKQLESAADGKRKCGAEVRKSKFERAVRQT